MKKTTFILGTILFCLLMISSSCTKLNNHTATISANFDSEFVNTFEDLGLGILFDFDLSIPHADQSWVNIWVEDYIDGNMEPDPITGLIHGLSPEQTTNGNIGFGIINDDTDDPLFFLYAPGVSITPHKVEDFGFSDGFSAWEYAIGDEKVELELGETKLLAAYRQSSGDSIRTYDLQDEDEVEKMIKGDSRVLLFKIKIAENSE